MEAAPETSETLVAEPPMSITCHTTETSHMPSVVSAQSNVTKRRR